MSKPVIVTLSKLFAGNSTWDFTRLDYLLRSGRARMVQRAGVTCVQFADGIYSPPPKEEEQ